MNRSNPPFPLRAGMIAGMIAAVIIVGYTFYAILPYLLGPSLTATEVTARGLPGQGETAVAGMTERVSYLSIDGMDVPLAEDGSFSVQRAYPMGYTAITISAKDRFGRTIIRTLSFLNK
jgi:hypothetical protein